MENDVDSVVITHVGASNWSKSEFLEEEDVYGVEITNIRKVQGQNFQTHEPEVHLEFEFTVKDEAFLGAKLYRIVTPKIGKGENNPSNLWKLIVATIGADTDTEHDFHISVLKGKALRVTTKNKEGKNGKYSHIEDFLPAKKK